jgi:uncharacterized protein YbjT (DUF2867 family)
MSNTLPTTNPPDPRQVLVIGANGKTGRRVAERLAARSIAVRGASRTTNPRFDWDDDGTWPAALEGVRAAYVTYSPDLAMPGADARIGRLGELASAAGVEHVVLLSGRGEAGAQASERALAGSGVPWTVLRSSWFMQNFSEAFLIDAVLHGELAVPVGDVAEPFVDIDDIADAAVEVLTTPGHVGRVYEVTGPRAVSFADAAVEIGQAIGRPIRFTQLEPDAFEAGLLQAGVPADDAGFVRWLFTEVLDGRNSATAPGIPQILGRPATDIRDFARAAAAAGAWDLPAEVQP